MRRYLGSLVLAVLTLLALWLLQQPDDSAQPAPVQPSSVSPSPAAPTFAPTAATTETATSTPSSTSPSSAPAAPPVDPVEPDGEPVDPTEPAIPRDDLQARQFSAYAQAAVTFMVDFARPPTSVSEQQWWGRVAPQLSEQAVVAYAGTDPQNVPFSEVTGPATILPSVAPSELLAIARVPTNAGWYRVEMTTSSDGIRITRATPESGGQR